MNIRLQKYKKNRLLGMDKYNAARKAGYSHNTAKNAYVNVEKRGKNMEDVFLKTGLTDEKIVEHALAGLEAVRELMVDGQRYGDTPDWQTRHKYFTTILNLTKKLSPVNNAGSGDMKIVVVYPPKNQNENRVKTIPGGISTGD